MAANVAKGDGMTQDQFLAAIDGASISLPVFNPVNVTLFGSIREVLDACRVANLIEKFRDRLRKV